MSEKMMKAMIKSPPLLETLFHVLLASSEKYAAFDAYIYQAGDEKGRKGTRKATKSI